VLGITVGVILEGFALLGAVRLVDSWLALGATAVLDTRALRVVCRVGAEVPGNMEDGVEANVVSGAVLGAKVRVDGAGVVAAQFLPSGSR